MEAYWEVFEWLKTHREVPRHEFESFMTTAYGVSAHDKVSLVLSLAWEYGHSNSHHKVLFFFNDLVKFLK